MFLQFILPLVEFFPVVLSIPETKLAQLPKLALDLRRVLAALEPEERACVGGESIGHGCVEFGKEAVRHFRALLAGLQTIVNGLGNESPANAADRRRNLFDEAVVLRRMQQCLQYIRNISSAQLRVAEPDRADLPCKTALARAP